MKRVAVITGGGSGIGRAICLALGSKGVSVVATDISRNSLEETVNLATADGSRCKAKLMDVTNSGMVRQTIEEIGQIDVAAGYSGIFLAYNLARTF